MPDLSKRPARYLTALVTAVLAGGYVVTQYGVRLGEDPDLAHVRKENAALRQQLSLVDEPPARSGRTCASFGNQQAAQAFWVAHRDEFPDWDGNRNGVVCEQLRSAASPGASSVRAQARPGAPESPAARPAAPAATRVVTRTRVVPAPAPVPSPTRPATRPAEPAPPPQQRPTPPAATPSAPSKATLLASRRHFGLYTGTTEEYDQLEATLARDTTIHGRFQGWDTPFRPEVVTASWARAELPMLTWESRSFNGADTDYSLASIAAGQHDDHLRTFARAVRTLGLPLAIRFDQEMNGNWYRWAEAAPAYGNQPGSYRAAWRHVHDVFTAEGAGDLVIWVWSPNRVDNIARLPSIDNYYPGDDYVDWVGMTGYFRPEDANATFASTFGRTLGELRRVAPGKPILLAEIGATETGGKKTAWAESFFPGLAAEPDVIGFVWFNYAVSEKGRTNDWRIQSSAEVVAAVRAGLYASGFGLDRGKKPSW